MSTFDSMTLLGCLALQPLNLHLTPQQCGLGVSIRTSNFDLHRRHFGQSTRCGMAIANILYTSQVY